MPSNSRDQQLGFIAESKMALQDCLDPKQTDPSKMNTFSFLPDEAFGNIAEAFPND